MEAPSPSSLVRVDDINNPTQLQLFTHGAWRHVGSIKVTPDALHFIGRAWIGQQRTVRWYDEPATVASFLLSLAQTLGKERVDIEQDTALIPFPATERNRITTTLAPLGFWSVGLQGETLRYVWRYASPATLIRQREVTVELLGSTAFPSLRFPRSGRPFTSMTSLRPPGAKAISFTTPYPSSAPRPITNEQGELVYVLPVTRYAAGMSRGLYYTEEVQSHCGTFYYWEPDSKVWLTLGKAGEFGFFYNKTGAALALAGRVSKERSDELLEVAGKVLDGSAELLEEYLAAYGVEVSLDTVYDDLRHFALTGTFATLPLDENFQYEGKYLDATYAAEDQLDQVLCLAGREAGLKCLILAKMNGSSRLVSEVLDTRSREESLQSLAWEV